eukprot:485781_1
MSFSTSSSSNHEHKSTMNPSTSINLNYFNCGHFRNRARGSHICPQMRHVLKTIEGDLQCIFVDDISQSTNRAKHLYVLASELHAEIVNYPSQFILPFLYDKLTELNVALGSIIPLFVRFQRFKQKKHINTLKDNIDSYMTKIEGYKMIITRGLHRSKQLIAMFDHNIRILSLWIDLFRIHNNSEHRMLNAPYESMSWSEFVVRIRTHKTFKTLQTFPLNEMTRILKQKYNAQHTENVITVSQFAQYCKTYPDLHKLSNAMYTYVEDHIISTQTKRSLPLSIGVSSWPPPELSPDDDIPEDEIDQDEPVEILDIPDPIWDRVVSKSMPSRRNHSLSSKQMQQQSEQTQTCAMHRSLTVSQIAYRHKRKSDNYRSDPTFETLSPLALDPIPQKQILVLNTPSSKPSQVLPPATRKKPKKLRYKPKLYKDTSDSGRSVGNMALVKEKSARNSNEDNCDSDRSNSSLLADNEFPIDPLPDHVTASPHFSFSPTPSVEMIKDPFAIITSEDAVRDLDKNTIIYHSLFKVYSRVQCSHFHVCGLLTMHRLYFVSGINYQTWQELRKRTKMDTLINTQETITLEMATELIRNLDIVEEKRSDRLLPYFVNNTKTDIMLHMLLNTNRAKMRTLSSYLHLDQDMGEVNEILNMKNDCLRIDAEPSKDIKYIRINGVNLVPESLRSGLLECVLEDVEWIEEQYVKGAGGHDVIAITLCKYHYKAALLDALNAKKRTYLMHNGLEHESEVFISEYNGNRIQYSLAEIKFIDLTLYDKVVPVTRYDTEDSFGFCIKSANKEDDVSVRMSSNNARHEWITHLDYVLYRIHKKDDEKETEADQTAKWIHNGLGSLHDIYNPTNQKLLNDFAEQNKSDSEPKEEENESYSTHFNFGMYLNYWQQGFENSVRPKYDTLKEELLRNKISALCEADYYELYGQCVACFGAKRFEIVAETIGPNNAKCNVAPGSSITLNHIIALKIYTDYTKTQCLFKKHCRKYNEEESMLQFIRRNAEIAHWCRYIRESTTFFGTKMKFKYVYTGLKDRLVFSSLTQQFYCPLSATVCRNIAENYCGLECGVLLKLQAAHGKARYFDVSWLSRFPNEKERLIMGSRMKICDIYINYDSSRGYILALHLLEQILNGYQVASQHQMAKEQLLHKMLSTRLGLNDYHMPKYIELLLNKQIDKMQHKMRCKDQLKRLWLNQRSITQLKHCELKCLFGGCEVDKDTHECALFFRHFRIKLADINRVRRFSWRIDGEEYETFKNMGARKCIRSGVIDYCINGSERDKIEFHLACYPRYTHEKQKCALFLHLRPKPKHIESIRVEYDLCCDWGDAPGKRKYQHVMIPQVLNEYKDYIGCQAFSSDKIRYEYMLWNIGIKITEVNKVRNMEPHDRGWSESELSMLQQSRSELMELLGQMTAKCTHIKDKANTQNHALLEQIERLKQQNTILQNKMSEMMKNQ